MRSCNCPNCNANMEIKENNRDFVFCQYCGSKIMLDDYRSTHRIIDEAKIKQYENERYLRLEEIRLERAKQEQQNQRDMFKKILTYIWLGMSLLVILIFLITLIVNPESAFFMFLFLLAPIIGGGAYLIFILLPNFFNK